MDKATLYEEIRALLREPQVQSVADPWEYKDQDFVPQVRSAIRHLAARGVLVVAVMDTNGEFTTDPAEKEGLLIALFVADRLLSGDLIQKLKDGELGIYFKSGVDIIDTRQAERAFGVAATRYRDDFQALLTMVLTDQDGGADSIYGDQIVYPA